jgi:hypothetical protein
MNAIAVSYQFICSAWLSAKRKTGSKCQEKRNRRCLKVEELNKELADAIPKSTN